MNIIRHRPATRGVTELMYVGDDQAVENAVQKPGLPELAAGAYGLYLAFKGKSKATKVVGAGIASVVALRMHSTGMF